MCSASSRCCCLTACSPSQQPSTASMQAGHIVPHDDRAYTQVIMEDGSMQICSRSIACIYYLTQGWSEADGGYLVDLEAPGGPQQHLPAFNSLVAFRIPRWHEVQPVTGDKPRYSIFGWFLEPGKLYDLNVAEGPPQQLPAVLVQGAEEQAEQQQQQHRQQHAVPAAKQKHRKKGKHVQRGQQHEAAKPALGALAGVKKRKVIGVSGLVQRAPEQQQQRQKQKRHDKQKHKHPGQVVSQLGNRAAQVGLFEKKTRDSKSLLL